MRVLIVDQDSSLLTALTQTLGEYFTIDAVTTKADCLDLLRANEFDVIVAGERLEDGSGLELLGQLGKHRPNMLRIFAAERERLKLLKGRLGPFGLFRTLSYPIEPRQLLAALSAAGDTQDEPAPAPTPTSRRASPAPGRSSPESAPTHHARPKTNGATPPARQAPAQPQSAPTSRTPARKVLAAQSPRVSGAAAAAMGSAATSSTQAAAARSPSPRSNGAQSSRRPTPAPVPQSGRVGSRMRPAARTVDDSLSDASRLAIEARSRNARAPSGTAPRRSGFLVGAGVVVVLGGLALAFKLFNASDDSLTSSSSVPVVRTPQFSPEVVKLVAETEAAFQQDDFKHARANLQTLQQTAPNHPRLAFFESLLRRRGEAPATESAEASRHEDRTPLRTASSASPTTPAREPAQARNAGVASRPRDTSPAGPKSRSAIASNSSRTPPVASTSPTSRPRAPQAPVHAPSAPAPHPRAATTAMNTSNSSSPTTFSGRILEDSNSARPTPPPAPIRQAAVTPPPQPAASQPATQEPRLVQHVAAEYPLSAADRGTEGLVDLSFVVARDGTVNDVTVVHSEPSAVFNRAAITAVRRWKYEPKTVNGLPVEAHLQLRLQFKLDHSGH